MVATVESVKDFVTDSIQLVSANSPTVTVQGGDTTYAVKLLNQLIRSYSGTGLLTTIADQVDFILPIGVEYVVFCDPDYPSLQLVPPVPPPTPPNPFTPVVVTSGRLSNLQNAWLTLENLTYPLQQVDRNVFLASYKFDPQQGLPRFVIITNNVNYTTMRVYPSASQQYYLSVYAKFQLPNLSINGDMSGTPGYWHRFLKFALAKDFAFFKGRMSAWTDRIAQELKDAKEDMESISSINMDIQSDEDSMLNGSWRVRSGI